MQVELERPEKGDSGGDQTRSQRRRLQVGYVVGGMTEFGLIMQRVFLECAGIDLSGVCAEPDLRDWSFQDDGWVCAKTLMWPLTRSPSLKRVTCVPT
jgi:hypothetical protein